MLVKLLRYDLCSLRRYGIPLLIAMLAGLLLGGISLPLLVNCAEAIPTVAERYSVLIVFLMLFCIFGVFAAFLLILLTASLFPIMACVDFYKSLLTDEGYLSFTLPVKRRDLLFSKLVSGVVWSVIGVLAAIVSLVAVIASLVIFTDVPAPGWQGILDFLRLFGLSDVFLLVQGLLYVLLSTISSLLLYYAAIFFGSVIARKHRLLAAIGCVIGANFIYSTVLGIVTMVVEFVTIFFGVSLGLGESVVMFHLLFGVTNLLMMASALLLFFFLERMMVKKLNLA